MRSCYMKGVHGSQSRFSGLDLSKRFNLFQSANPFGRTEELVVKRLFQALLVICSFGNKLEVNERTSDEDSIGILKNGQRAFLISPGATGSGEDETAVQKGSDHSPLANSATALRDFAFDLSAGEGPLSRGRYLSSNIPKLSTEL